MSGRFSSQSSDWFRLTVSNVVPEVDVVPGTTVAFLREAGKEGQGACTGTVVDP